MWERMFIVNRSGKVFGGCKGLKQKLTSIIAKGKEEDEQLFCRTSSKPRAGHLSHQILLLNAREESFKKTVIQHMMYGFGDDANPLPETVALLEDIVVEYVTDLVHKAQETASKRGKLLTEDFLFLMRKDLPKLNRCTELLSMNEELKQARKAFDVDEEKLATME
ncbi:Transcription initiation factor TFIID subunit 13 [Vitis vinifera]|uniref:Transcription initiation factor TFIID subunit 13 n=1 Tax=Vitis vinifera TaxID=29760 RepID=A0A438FJ18_VITVI|nr:Transcription initiation factor TFIID subunit 13 [Vitis vinifera]